MVLDLCKIFVSAQYLENKLAEFHMFIDAFILTRSSFGLLHVIFYIFIQEQWPLIYANIFSLNILRTNWQNFAKFYLCIHFDKIEFVTVL